MVSCFGSDDDDSEPDAPGSDASISICSSLTTASSGTGFTIDESNVLDDGVCDKVLAVAVGSLAAN